MSSLKIKLVDLRKCFRQGSLAGKKNNNPTRMHQKIKRWLMTHKIEKPADFKTQMLMLNSFRCITLTVTPLKLAHFEICLISLRVA